VDSEAGEAIDRLSANLDQLGAKLDRFATDLRAQIRESHSGMRRHFDVVAESLRCDIRAIAEGLAASLEQKDWQLCKPRRPRRR
jgi:hypothetical protein